MFRRAPTREVNRDALRLLIETGGVPFRQNPRSWRLHCPRCGKSKLYVQRSDGRCKCMKCAEEMRGWADRILAPIYGRTVDELRAILYDDVEAGVAEFDDLDFTDHWDEWCDPDEVALADGEDSLPPPLVWSPDVVDIDKPAARAGLAYLEGRDISLNLAKRYGVRYDVRQRRVCFPVVVDGVLRGWQGRYIDKCEVFTPDGAKFIIPKILTVGEVGGKCLMFQDRLKGSEHGILVEGPVDAIKCDLAGGNAATMGKSFTPEQVRCFLGSGIRRLYVGLDDDAADRIMETARLLSSRVELFRLATPPGREDLGDATVEEVYREFLNAKPLNPAHLFTWTEDPDATFIAAARWKRHETVGPPVAQGTFVDEAPLAPPSEDLMLRGRWRATRRP